MATVGALPAKNWLWHLCEEVKARSGIELTDCDNSVYRGVSGGWAGWAIAHLVFGILEGTAGQLWRSALLLAHPDLGSQLRPCYG